MKNAIVRNSIFLAIVPVMALTLWIVLSLKIPVKEKVTIVQDDDNRFRVMAPIPSRIQVSPGGVLEVNIQDMGTRSFQIITVDKNGGYNILTAKCSSPIADPIAEGFVIIVHLPLYETILR